MCFAFDTPYGMFSAEYTLHLIRIMVCVL